MANIKRLKQLRRVVDAAPDDRLHMRSFCEQAECGTAYCAAGWAAIDPWFRKNTGISNLFAVSKLGIVMPLHQCDDGTLGELFGLSDVDAYHLFAFGQNERIGPHDITKPEVVANIDRLIAGQNAVKYQAMTS